MKGRIKMRLAVLISTYIVLAYCGVMELGLIAADDPSAGLTFVGLVVISIPLILSLIYAHSKRDK